MAEDLGGQLMQFGNQLRGAIEAPARAELEMSKLRQQQEKSKPNPNEILENLASEVYKSQDPEGRKLAMDKFNQAAELLGPMIERMQRIKADWKKTYGEDVPMDEPKIAKAPLPPGWVDDPPEKPSLLGAVINMGEEAIKSGSIDALRQAKDPKRQAALKQRYAEKEAVLRKHFKSVDPDGGLVEENDYVNEAMDKLKKRDEAFDEGMADDFKMPSEIKYVQTFGYEKLGGSIRKVRKARGEKKEKSKEKPGGNTSGKLTAKQKADYISKAMKQPSNKGKSQSDIMKALKKHFGDKW